jgi:hypothetical protein
MAILFSARMGPANLDFLEQIEDLVSPKQSTSGNGILQNVFSYREDDLMIDLDEPKMSSSGVSPEKATKSDILRGHPF